MIKKTTKQLYQLFDVTEEWAKKRKRLYLQSQIKDIKEQTDRWHNIYATVTPNNYWFIEDRLKELLDQLNSLEKRLKFYSSTTNFNNEIDIEELKKIPIQTVLPQGLKKEYASGNREKYLCPLHNEKSPSFVIYKDTNSFHCFGCQAGGSIIDLVMELENVSVGEAIKKLKNMI